MKFLIIDDSGSLRSLLKKRLLQKWPEAVIRGYDPRREGRPGEDFSWHEYDIVFLDYELGLHQETGLDWLPQIKRSNHAPGVIMVTGHGNESVAVRAIRQGADDYLIKYDVVAEKLYEMVTTCLAQQGTAPASHVSSRQRPDHVSAAWESPGTGKAAVLTAPEHEPGSRHIPGYKCIRKLGRGLTTTLLTERAADGELQVLKVLNLQEGATITLKRFMQELNILSALDHPHIIKVRDRGVTEQFFYYAVDYYPKGDLANAISAGGITAEMATAYVLQIARGLSGLHSAGILHRDIKPNNILFADTDTLVIADLGIAKDLACSEAMTSHGQVIGTPYYMSPEQIESSAIDRRSDIYSLGVLFFELLTGNRPFPGASIMEVAYKHAYDPIPRLSSALAKWQPVLDKMLAKMPDDRYQDVEQLIQEVTAAERG